MRPGLHARQAGPRMKSGVIWEGGLGQYHYSVLSPDPNTRQQEEGEKTMEGGKVGLSAILHGHSRPPPMHAH